MWPSKDAERLWRNLFAKKSGIGGRLHARLANGV
jgi:hypothetical protein